MFSSLRHITDMLVGGQELLEEGYNHWPAQLPVLIYHGDKDEVTSHNSSTELFNKLPAQDKTYKTFPDGYHELHNEPDGVREKVIEECISFIEAHLERPSERPSEPEVTAKL
jgi:acylglycerol lipase